MNIHSPGSNLRTAPQHERLGNEPPVPARRWPFYYGWVVVVVSSIAMTATLPGRTHGLGLVTEPLIDDLGIERTLFARINMAACLIGAAFCLPIGTLIDCLGARLILTVVTAGLGAAVIGMTHARSAVALFVTLLFVRGLGQSALSVVSMAAVGKWFRGRLGAAMGVYTVLLTVGFIGSIVGMGHAVKVYGWAEAWAGLGWILLTLVAPFSWLLQRDSPEACGETLDAAPIANAPAIGPELDFTLRQALATPAFWVFAMGTSAFNLVWSAVTLFNESVLAERGFDKDVAVQVMAALTGAGLVSNLIAGAVARRERLGMLLGIGMALLTAALAWFPTISSLAELWTYAAAMGLTGGVVMVVFFAAWGQVFGRSHLGQIQGAAQLISVLASAGGPLLLAECQVRVGAYGPIFYGLAAFTAVLSLIAFWTPLPQARSISAIEVIPSTLSEQTLPLPQET